MRHFFNALRYSCDGFMFLLKETAFRQELLLLGAALALVCCAAGLPGLLEALPWGLAVLVTEALNTGIEKAVDLCTLARHPLAKAAKDCGSFACGAAIAAFLAVCVRVAVF